MSEKAPNNQKENSADPISHEDAIADPNKRPLYISQRVASIREGKKIWMIRGFHGLETAEDPAVIYDYHFAGLRWGYIEGNDLDGFDDYGAVFERVEGELVQTGMVHLNTEPIENFFEAQKVLEHYVHQAVLKHPPAVE